MALMTSLKESPWTFIDLIPNEWNWPNFPTLGICHVQNWAWNSEFPFPKCNGRSRMDKFSFSICIVHSVFKEHPNYLEGFQLYFYKLWFFKWKDTTGQKSFLKSLFMLWTKVRFYSFLLPINTIILWYSCTLLSTNKHKM